MSDPVVEVVDEVVEEVVEEEEVEEEEVQMSVLDALKEVRNSRVVFSIYIGGTTFNVLFAHAFRFFQNNRFSRRLLSMMVLRRVFMNALRLLTVVLLAFVVLLRTARTRSTRSSSVLSVLRVRFLSSWLMLERISELCAVLLSLMRRVPSRRLYVLLAL